MEDKTFFCQSLSNLSLHRQSSPAEPTANKLSKARPSSPHVFLAGHRCPHLRLSPANFRSCFVLFHHHHPLPPLAWCMPEAASRSPAINILDCPPLAAAAPSKSGLTPPGSFACPALSTWRLSDSESVLVFPSCTMELWHLFPKRLYRLVSLLFTVTLWGADTRAPSNDCTRLNREDEEVSYKGICRFVVNTIEGKSTFTGIEVIIANFCVCQYIVKIEWWMC